MYAMSLAAMKEAGISKFELLVDGDDTLCIVEKEDSKKLDPFLQSFTEFGHEIKMEGKWTQLEGITWCQNKFAWIDGKPRFVRPWQKVLSCLTGGCKHWNEVTVQKDMMYTVGQALMIDNVGTPILGLFGKTLCKWSNNRIKDWTNLDEGWFWGVKERHGLNFIAEYKEPELSSRLSFERAFGVSVQEQLEIEHRLARWVPEFGEPQVVDDEIVRGWKTNYRPDLEPVPL